MALPNSVTSFEDGDPIISAGFGALISGSGAVRVEARAVCEVVGVAACGASDGGVATSSTAQAVKLITEIKDMVSCRRNLVVTIGVSLFWAF